MGVCETVALAATQSGKTERVCDGAGTLRHGGSNTDGHQGFEEDSAQYLCDGPQVDVEQNVGRVSGQRVFESSRSAARWHCGKNAWFIRDIGSPCGRAKSRVGRETGFARRRANSYWCIRCALGHDWSGSQTS